MFLISLLWYATVEDLKALEIVKAMTCVLIPSVISLIKHHIKGIFKAQAICFILGVESLIALNNMWIMEDYCYKVFMNPCDFPISHNQSRASPANTPHIRNSTRILPSAFCSGAYKSNKNIINL